MPVRITRPRSGVKRALDRDGFTIAGVAINNPVTNPLTFPTTVNVYILRDGAPDRSCGTADVSQTDGRWTLRVDFIPNRAGYVIRAIGQTGAAATDLEAASSHRVEFT